MLKKNVVEGARVKAGEDLFRIADLSEVWVETDVYDFDAPWVHLGAKAKMRLSYDPGQTFDANVAFVNPTLDVRTRTLRVRLEVPNTDLEAQARDVRHRGHRDHAPKGRGHHPHRGGDPLREPGARVRGP